MKYSFLLDEDLTHYTSSNSPGNICTTKTGWYEYWYKYQYHYDLEDRKKRFDNCLKLKSLRIANHPINKCTRVI